MNQETLANGRYVVQRRLATGGMGEVLLAHFGGDDEVSAGLLVVKRILAAAPGMAPNEQQVRMLLEEARLGQRLSHENLVETFKVEMDGDSPILVIELLAGRSMAQVLGQAKKRKEMVPIDVALAVLRGACCGLHFAHTLKGPDGASLGLVHRDVSPANIFITFDGKVKVIDFGVAKSDDSEVKTATGILKGKLGYMSPEQSVGDTRLTAQADVWSLGVFFWEMLLAERLFSSPNPTATLLQISQKEIPLPRALRPDVPPAVEAIAMKMLTRAMDGRFKSCAEIVRAIDALPGVNVKGVDVGAFVAGRFPEEAAAGSAEAAGCARRKTRVFVARDIAEGTTGVDPADDDALATTILPSGVREQLLASVGRPGKAAPPKPSPIADVVDDAATVRVSPDVLAQVRAASTGNARPLKPTAPAVVDDEEDVATRRVDRDTVRAARTGDYKVPVVDAPPSATEPSAPPTPVPDPNRPPTGGFARPADPGPPPPSALTSSSQPRPRAGLSVTSMSSSTLPSVTRSESATWPVAPVSPIAEAQPPVRGLSTTVAMVTPPAQDRPATSWLAVAVATFGALVLLMGFGFSAVLPGPPVQGLVVYEDTTDHFSVIVADRALVPVGREARDLDLDQAALHGPGQLDASPVPRALLEERLKAAGVWQYAQLPKTSKAKTAALLPLLVVAVGLLALGVALPMLFLQGGRRLAVQAVLAAITIAFALSGLQGGALSWPGSSAFAKAPRLEWK